MAKVLIVEKDPTLGPMVEYRLQVLVPELRSVILTITSQDALAKAENAKQIGIRVAVVGKISRYRDDLLDEQQIINTLNLKMPGIAIISCTGQTMIGADVDVPRPEGYLNIEEVVKSFLGKKPKVAK